MTVTARRYCWSIEHTFPYGHPERRRDDGRHHAEPLDAADLVDLDPATLDNEGLGLLLDRLEATRRLIDGARLRAQGEFDHRQAHVEQGAVTPAPALSYRTGRSGRSTRAELATARKLRRLPHLAAAVASGAVTAEHADVVCRAFTTKTAAAMDRDEATLVADARRLDVDRFTKLMARWKAHADPDGSVDPADRLRNQWQCSQSFDGHWFGSCRFDNETGGVIATAVNDQVAELLRQAPDGERRPIASVRAEAVAELISRGAGVTADGAARSRPRAEIAVTISLDDLRDELGLGDAVGAQAGLSASAIRRLACDADIIPVVLGGKSVVLDIGARTASAPQRLALRITDGDTCANPKCDRPGSWCEVHHIEHWVAVGATRLGNLIAVCRHCHHLLHEGGHRVRRLDDGHLEWRDANGTLIPYQPRAGPLFSVPG